MDKALSYSGFIGGPRNTAISSGFYSLIRAIRRSNSKGEEERIVQKELDLIRQNLSQPDVSLKKMKEFMVRLIYCEMLGQSANFAYIHAIKMAQQGVLLNKRVGYLGVSLFLHSQHELILLLINTIQKDLNSTNVLDVCGGLTACGNLIGAEMVPVVLPLIEQNLQHPHESVRRKAVLVLHSFVLKCPHLICHMKEHLQQALCDRSPGVMTAALHVYQALIKGIRGPFENIGLEERVVDVLTASWRDSTKKQYRVYWTKWKRFCERKKTNHLRTSIGDSALSTTSGHTSGEQRKFEDKNGNYSSAIANLMGKFHPKQYHDYDYNGAGGSDDDSNKVGADGAKDDEGGQLKDFDSHKDCSDDDDDDEDDDEDHTSPKSFLPART
eukprot:XP_011671589.1 PREDICTED: AP-4 complex subunit epsilon-1-like [Strongylocentrotus purpuratus]